MRFDQVNRAISQAVVPKRAQLLGQIQRVDQKLDEIKNTKKMVEQDIKREYGAILERLRSSEGAKLAVLQHDISEI